MRTYAETKLPSASTRTPGVSLAARPDKPISLFLQESGHSFSFSYVFGWHNFEGQNHR